MTNVALPTLGEEFGLSEGQGVISGYLLVSATGIQLYGRLAGVYSLKEAFSLNLAAFSASSLVCALVPNLATLVTRRWSLSLRHLLVRRYKALRAAPIPSNHPWTMDSDSSLKNRPFGLKRTASGNMQR